MIQYLLEPVVEGLDQLKDFSMDRQIAKWMAEALRLMADNLKTLDKTAGMGPAASWPAAWQSLVPGLPAAPLPPPAMEEFYREWLALFGAVPQKDYEELKARVEELEARRERAEKAMDMLAQGMKGLQDVPEAMKPWMEFVDQAAKAQMEWFAGLGQAMDNPDGSTGKGPESGGIEPPQKK